MPRRARFCPAGLSVHVIQRGNNRQAIFTSDDDLAAYARTGTLYEGRYKASIVQEERYFLTCLRYIELNPVRAGMVKDPDDHLWSSFRAHAFGQKPRMWQAHPEYIALGQTRQPRHSAYRTLFADHLSQEQHGNPPCHQHGTGAWQRSVSSGS